MKKYVLCILAMLSVSAYLPMAMCEEDPKSTQAEADEAAAEDEAAAKLDGEVSSPLKGISVRGQFISQPADDDKNAVIGYFKNKEKTYLAKCPDNEVRKQLAAISGKEITLYGKERNKGKYFIIQSIQIEDEGATNRRKKKGF